MLKTGDCPVIIQLYASLRRQKSRSQLGSFKFEADSSFQRIPFKSTKVISVIKTFIFLIAVNFTCPASSHISLTLLLSSSEDNADVSKKPVPIKRRTIAKHFTRIYLDVTFSTFKSRGRAQIFEGTLWPSSVNFNWNNFPFRDNGQLKWTAFSCMQLA